MVYSFYIGSPWNEGVSPCGSCWLLLSNLTPQVMMEKLNMFNKNSKIAVVLKDQCHILTWRLLIIAILFPFRLMVPL